MMSKIKKTREVKTSQQPVKISKLLKKKFVIPQQFINQLNEFTSHGYVLIIAGANGEPQVISRFDSSVDALGLTKFGADYFGIMENKLTNMIGGAFLGERHDQDGGEEMPQ